MFVTESQAKKYFELGVLKGALILPPDLQASDGIQVLFQGDGQLINFLLCKSRGGVRTFKTYDAAIKLIEEVGFKSIKVELKK